jgi:hypothetical protein
MARIAIERAAWIVLAVAAGSVGFLSGRSEQIKATIALLQVEAAANLTQRIEVLSLLRMDDVPGAITRLESEADGLTTSIAANRGADQRALAYVKTYLSVAPPSASRARALSAALEGVPTLNPDKCETALKALLLSP